MNVSTATAFLVTAMKLGLLQHVLTCEHEAENNTVNCTSRGLTEVPSNTFTDVITVLVLTSNNLEILENKAFGEYPDVTSLFLKKNNIRIVQEKAFQGLDKLVVLDLSFNKISYFYNTAFVSNVNLETLNLSENPLQNLPPTTPLISSKSLNTLLLSKSNITRITKHTFSGLDNLEHLDLTSNSLSHIPADIFKPLRKLDRVFLAGNPLRCDVMKEWLLSEQDLIADYKKTQCVTSDVKHRALPRKPRQTTRITFTSSETSSQEPIETSSSEAAYSSSTSITLIEASTVSKVVEVTDAKSVQEPTVSPMNGEKKNKKNIDDEYSLSGTFIVYVYCAMMSILLLTCVVVVFLLRHHINDCFHKLHHKTSTVDLKTPGVDAAKKSRLGRRSSLEPIYESIVDLSNI